MSAQTELSPESAIANVKALLLHTNSKLRELQEFLNALPSTVSLEVLATPRYIALKEQAGQLLNELLEYFVKYEDFSRFLPTDVPESRTRLWAILKEIPYYCGPHGPIPKALATGNLQGARTTTKYLLERVSIAAITELKKIETKQKTQQPREKEEQPATKPEYVALGA